LHSSRQSVPIL